MRCWKVKTRLTMLMIGPTNTAEITVPMPTPRNPWKKINDSTAAMMISVMSKYGLHRAHAHAADLSDGTDHAFAGHHHHVRRQLE